MRVARDFLLSWEKAMRFALAIIIGTMISTAAFCEERVQSTGNVDWDKSLTTYDVDKTSFYDFGLPDDNQVSAPSYSNLNDAPPAYPFGNSVKLENGVSCTRNGITISCK
jgi:hypothetical protein